MQTTDLYLAWKSVLAYPKNGNCEPVAIAIDELRRERPSLAEYLQPLRELVAKGEPAVLEEAYMHTFDCNPERALELGWHLFGESYSRGNFLVRMRGFMRDCKLDEDGELPDHLCNVLAVMATAEQGLADALRKSYLLPALEKMEKGFLDEADPYRGVIAGLKSYVEAEAGQQSEGDCNE